MSEPFRGGPDENPASRRTKTGKGSRAKRRPNSVKKGAKVEKEGGGKRATPLGLIRDRPIRED